MLKEQKWITSGVEQNVEKCFVFRKTGTLAGKVKKATLCCTARGVYEAEIGGKRVGEKRMTPGFTVYPARHLYQTYDVTELLDGHAFTLDITVTAGWYYGRMRSFHSTAYRNGHWDDGVIAEMVIEYEDGKRETVATDGTWLVGTGSILYSDLYDGEIYDATKTFTAIGNAVTADYPTDALTKQDGEDILEHERFSPKEYIITPKGETVIDFGQNVTGYAEISLDAKAGDVVSLSFAEILDKDGNFYNENYRSAKCQYIYTCRDGKQSYKPHLTFYGFRYIRVDKCPCGVKDMTVTLIAVHSALRRTGYLSCGVENLNKLFSNIVWGQKDNFLDIPTDCPQRDERLGWTGDAEVFSRTACLNFDCEKFYTKWLRDMAAENKCRGYVGWIIPRVFDDCLAPAWSDAAVIIPYRVFEAYGNKALLEEHLPMMLQHLDNIAARSAEPYTWSGKDGIHYFGDWLAMDAEPGSYVGSTRLEFIGSAYYAYDVSLVIDALQALGRDTAAYEELHGKIVAKFRENYPTYTTQTECALALYFGLASDRAATAKQLADMIRANGDRLTTGFVGTPYLLHALSENGYADVAYTLLLQNAYPSWLFSVEHGATTMWEHWDGINDKGDVWSKDMNSYNHYGYGAVADWVYAVAGGITPLLPGYEKVRVAPIPDRRLGHLDVTLDTRHGKVRSAWRYDGDKVFYTVTVPTDAELVIDGRTYTVSAGTHTFGSR